MLVAEHARVLRASGMGRSLCVAVVALLAAAGCGNATGPEHEISGKVLYDQYCARCHGEDGTPVYKELSSLNDRRLMDQISDMAFDGIVRGGRPALRDAAGKDVVPAMPAFGEQFTDATMMVLVAYVRSFSGSMGPHAREEPEGDPKVEAP
jgi:mono/diheme cytochrome c family protein